MAVLADSSPLEGPHKVELLVVCGHIDRASKAEVKAGVCQARESNSKERALLWNLSMNTFCFTQPAVSSF